MLANPAIILQLLLDKKCISELVSQMRKSIPGGVVHKVPKDLRALLLGDDEAFAVWVGLTPLARNEWICWILSAKKEETRDRKIVRIRADLLDGKRRPCCWPGCKHRGET